MHIKLYKTKRFAGIRDVELDFKEGVNVILGDNESGKSTIIEGIHSTLFKGVKLKKNNNRDKDFSFKFMPIPSGDSIDGRLIISNENGEYEISKEWGSSESISLLKPDGAIIKKEEDIHKEVFDLLGYGENTYTNIVFAKQRDFKSSLNNILENKDLSMEINTVLRKMLMNLDGISIDEVQKNIEEEIDGLYKRWNRDKNYPDNNRGINNPYKTGIGVILDLYYKKENLKLIMEQAYESENEFEKICEEIKILNEKKETYKKEKLELEKIEGDINTREVCLSRLESIGIKLADLRDVNTKWPRSLERLKGLASDLERVKESKEKILEEKANLDKFNKKIILNQRLEKIDSIYKEIYEVKEEIEKNDLIKADDIERIEDINNRLIEIKALMQAGNLFVNLKRSTEKETYIAKDFNEKELLKVNEEIKSEGIVKIYYGEEFELQVKSGKVDYEALNEERERLRGEYHRILEEGKADDIEALREKFKRVNDLKVKLSKLNSILEFNLGENSLEELRAQYEELKDIKVFKSLEQVEIEILQLSKDEIQVSTDIQTCKNNLESWESKYENTENLLNLLLIELDNQKKEEEKLNSLSPLPSRFNSIEEFKERLVFLRESLDAISLDLEEANKNYFTLKANLLDESYEEIKRQYEEAEDYFMKSLKRGEKLHKIRNVFLETKERLSKNPMEPLVNEFTRLLNIITDGSYNIGEIDEDFNIRIENSRGEIPVDLLSAGTYDSVALALRFSLFKHIFPDKKAYMVLDDCLVDLDPSRKLQAVDLIKDFSKDYQIIFTTCDPETAKMLGGNIINI